MTVPDYYVLKCGWLYELRQTRYARFLEQGDEHPHDVCAVATSRADLEQMVEACFKGRVNWSTLKEEPCASSENPLAR